MSSTLNIQLTKELRRFVDERASDHDVYATPSEYIRDLIRHDMAARAQAQEWEVAAMLMDARNTPTTPLADDFMDAERQRLRERSNA